MFIPFIGYLLFLQTQGTGVFGHSQRADEYPACIYRPGYGSAAVDVWSGGAQNEPVHAGIDAIYCADAAICDRGVAL